MIRSLPSPLGFARPFLASVMALAGLPAVAAADETESLLEALTFHASFDGKLDADFAKGDARLYTTVRSDSGEKTEPGLVADPEVISHEKGEGRFGDCLHFHASQAPRVFFPVRDNLPYAESDWEGTVSFWLRTTPDEDLDEGYTDPIQVTPRSALDACLFFEFGIEDPRPCRLGVFADRLAWNPEDKPNRDIPIPQRPLITVEEPPFSRDRWTHIVFTFEGFNNGDKAGVARLYLDGEPRGELTGWAQDYTWDLDQSQIRLGVKYIGRLDELSCFDRALSAEEVQALFALQESIGERF